MCVRESRRGERQRQEVLLWGAGTVMLIKARLGDTMGGVPLFIHQPPLPPWQAEGCVSVCVCVCVGRGGEDTERVTHSVRKE